MIVLVELYYAIKSVFFLFYAASDHQAGSGNVSDKTRSAYLLMSEEQFSDVLKKCIVKSMDILETRHSNMQHFARYEKHILHILSACKNSETVNKIQNCIKKGLYILFKQPILTPFDRERFFSRVHELKLDIDMQDAFLQQLGLAHLERCNIVFYQVFIKELIEAILAQTIVINEREFDNKPSKHSQSEQEILYYISGFIIKKLKQNSTKLHCLRNKENILLCLMCDGTDLEFLSTVRSWTCELDRGGLQYPSKDFYLLIREIDYILSSDLHIDTLHANSLLKSKSKDEIFDSYMVNYYWGRLLQKSGSTDGDCISFLEYVIDIFLNVKGFAISKKVRQDVAASTSKASSSFRKKLKGQ